jgi:Tol biopolymer transport system component
MSYRVCVPALLALALPLGAQSLKLSGPLARGVRGSIGYLATSPDGLTHVYPADLTGDGMTGLYATASSGKEPRRLVSPSTRGEGAFFAPDGRRVIHAVDLDGNGAFEQAVVPIDGSAPDHALTGLLPAHANVQSYGLASDGIHFVYTADADADEVVELYASSLDGGAPVKLSGAMVPGGDVVSLVLARQGPLVLYLADQDEDEAFELFVASVDGSQPARTLPIPLVSGGDVGFFEFDADASHALYVADQEEDERFELFSIATDGSQAPVKLSQALVAGGDVGGGLPYGITFASYDRRWILYSADALADEEFALYSVPADGSGPPVELAPPSPSGAVVTNLSWDSRWVVFDTDPDTSAEFFSVPIDGSAPARPVSGPYVTGGSAYFGQVSYDSTRFVYVADQDTDELFELYSTSIDGSAPPIKLSAPLVPGGDVALDRRFLVPGFYVMTDGVMYLADQEVDGRIELYFVPQGGGAPRKLVSAPMDPFAIPDVQPWNQVGEPRDFGRVLFRRGPGVWSVAVTSVARAIEIDRPEAEGVVGGVTSFRMDSSGARVVYLANEEGDLGPELDSVPPDKPQLRVPLGFDLSESERIESFELAVGATRVVFRMYLGSQPQIFSVPAAGGEAPRTLGPVLVRRDDFVGPIVLAPDGTTVVFYGQLDTQWRLLATPADGSAPARTVASLPSIPRGQPRLSADGSRVAILLSGGLYALPFDGSAPAVRLSAGNQLVEDDYQLTPDGTTVVYRTEADSTRVGQLFAAPGDGSAPARRISEAIAVGQGDVQSFRLAPDGSRAVYLADALVNDRYELASVPLDGSAPPVRLHPALAAGGDVVEFRVSADSARAVYLADQVSNDRFELFSAPLDASRAPVRISVELQAGGAVAADFEITPDSGRVLYRARPGGFQGLALFSTPIRGRGDSARLSRGLGVGADVEAFAVSADSSTVAFRARREDSQSLLLAAPSDGREKATVISGPFPGTVHDFAVSSDGSRLAWRADQDVPSVVELYAASYEVHPPLRKR